MSFRRPGQYSQNQQQQGYQEQYNQYQQPQNGGYGQPQYPGQQTYGQPAGQQSGYQEGYYQPARQASYAQYPGQQMYQYNPQDFAPPQQQQQPPVPQRPVQQYNPQTYGPSGQPAYAQQQYNPQSYSPASGYAASPIEATATSGPVDPWAYQPGYYSTQSPQRPAQSPQSARNQTYPPHYNPAPPQQYDGYAQPGASATYSSAYSPADPALNNLANDWQPSSSTYGLPDARQSPSPLYQPTPPSHGPTRSDTTGRHPTSRPLPVRPEPDLEPDNYYDHMQEEDEAQDALYREVESAVMGVGSSAPHSPAIAVSQAPYEPQRLSSTSHLARNGSVAANGHLSPTVERQQYYSSDSDAEAAQGLEMMRLAEEDDRRRQSGVSQVRLSSGTFSQRNSQQQYVPSAPPVEASDSDENFGTVDMSSFGGGYDVHMTYGGDPSVLAAGGDLNGYDTYNQANSSQHSSMRRSHASQSSQASRGDFDYGMDSIHPFRPFNAPARVDAGGTGGLSEPTADGRRQSFDEGDENYFMDSGVPERFPDEPPDIFYRPASTSFRPLPPPPEGEYPPHIQTDLRITPNYPGTPDSFQRDYKEGQWVPRSSSLMNHSSSPAVHQPLRSKTDAEERRLKAQQNRGSALSTIEGTPATLTPAIDLPSLPGKRFVASQLGAPAFKKCEEPWSLMSLLKWLLQVTNTEQGFELKEADVKEALVALFTNKVPTMNIADAETLSNRVVQDMYEADTLVTTEEWVKIVPGTMQGVIFQLTASGCYSPTLHDHVIPGRCYSHHCQRTLKKVNLQAQPVRTSESWAEFYKLKKEDIEGKDKKELERQYMLHEIVQTEDMYMEQLNVLRSLYRDPLSSAEPSIITPKRQAKFVQDVFGKVDAVKQANEDHLLPQLKYRQQEQGPWIVGFSDIFRQWIRKAKAAYIDYAGGFPGATFMVRQEIDRNMEFRSFIERARNDKRSNKLGWDTFLKAPITRLQRYTLLLNSVLKTMKTESEEKTNLKIAYDEVKAVTLECDARVAEMQRKVDLTDLSYKLVLRPGMQNEVELNLDHFGRELIHRGDLQRMGGNRFTWLDSHGMLFDHYMVIAKTVAHNSEQGGKIEKYDVSRMPIPMDLLILESSNDPAVQKSSYVKGITSVHTVTARTTTPQVDQSALSRTESSASPAPPGLQHTNTSSSASTLQTVTSITDSKDADKIMYPFKIKHLGKETYTLFAPTEQARREWIMKITEAKTKHAHSLYNQNAEPFKLRVMADSAFVFDGFAGTGTRAPHIKGTPVDRAVSEVEQKFKGTGRPGPICRMRVNCATSFTTPQPDGKQMVAVGTDMGVFISEMGNPRGWTKVIPMSRVTQVAVLEMFNAFLLIADKSLIAYHLDVVCPDPNTTSTSNDSAAKAPKKLSGSKDVGFFVTGQMKDRTLLVYKKRENMASVFKVLEPIYQKSTEKRRGMFRRGNTEFFRDYDEFYIPAECSGINLFHSSLAVGTARGFEVLTLDKKQPWSVPELTGHQNVQNIATTIKDQRALAMMRVSDQEFLLVYANCAVYVNKHGDVSRSVIMNFVSTAHQSVALYGPYLILFDSDFVEIRNAQNGRLKQIIPGHEIKCLDDGGSWSSAGLPGMNGTANGTAISGRTVKFVMQHPEMEKTQLIVEMLLSEGSKD